MPAVSWPEYEGPQATDRSGRRQSWASAAARAIVRIELRLHTGGSAADRERIWGLEAVLPAVAPIR